MPSVALGSGKSIVACTDGTIGTPCKFTPTGTPVSWNWNTPVISASDKCSSTVFANKIGVVRQGDAMRAHADGVPCTPSPIPHTPALTKGSSNVFVEGRELARIGDKYNTSSPFNHVITSGSGNVFAGG